MIGKIITLPFWIISKIVRMAMGTLKIMFSMLSGFLKLFLIHLFGAVIGAIIGFFLGKKHIGVKLWKHKKKHHNK
jgi:hypothetical protein